MAILSTALFSTCGCLQNTKFFHWHSLLSTSSVKACNTRALSVNSVSGGLKVASKDDIQYLCQWLTEEGGISSSSTFVKPEIVPQRLGLVAQRNISQGEVVLEVPKKIWISLDTVYASEIGKLCQGLRPWVAISLFVLREKSRSNSPWRPYLNILPQTLDSPLFWRLRRKAKGDLFWQIVRVIESVLASIPTTSATGISGNITNAASNLSTANTTCRPAVVM